MYARLVVCLFTLISMLSCFSGCQYMKNWRSEPVTSEVPTPSAYTASRQQKMQAIHHWEVLAQNIAVDIGTRMAKDFPEYQEAIYVAPAGITPFDKAFHDLLITNLVNNGLVVSHNCRNPLVLSFNTQILSHNRLPETNPGAAERRIPKKEVMITLSLMYKSAYLMRDSSIYYINEPEWWQYAQKADVMAPSVAVYTLVDK